MEQKLIMTSPEKEKEIKDGGIVRSSSLPVESGAGSTCPPTGENNPKKEKSKARLGNKTGNVFFFFIILALSTFVVDNRTVKKASVPSLWGSEASATVHHQANFTAEEKEILLKAARLQIEEATENNRTVVTFSSNQPNKKETTTKTTAASESTTSTSTAETIPKQVVLSRAEKRRIERREKNQNKKAIEDPTSAAGATTTTFDASTPASVSPTTASSSSVKASNVDTTPAISHNNNNGENTGLWIHVVEFAEGMAAWRAAFFELLVLAKSLNATLVEPCVVGGRLSSCTRAPKTAVRLGDYYDLRQARQYHSKIASAEEFIEATGYNHTSPQLYNKKTPNMFALSLDRKQSDLGKLLNVAPSYDRPTQKNLDKAIENSVNATTILEITTMRKWSLNKYQYQGKTLDKQLADRLMSRTFFRQEQFDYVRSLLRTKFNIKPDDKFGVIQWRPELKGLNYTDCAHAILETRDVVSSQRGIPKENFILISPLSHRKSMQWGGVATMAKKDPTSYPSLQMLMDAGFHKLEEALPVNITDGSLLVVWDMITAMMAEDLSSCARCPKSVCGKCNYQGAASLYTVMLQDAYIADKKEKTTNVCWPISRK